MKWSMVGSASSLAGVCELVEQRWYWTVCVPVPTDVDGVWSVENSKGPVSGLRIIRKGKRYRFEMGRESA